MKRLLKKILRPSLFILGGALLGYLYYIFFGCNDGCAIRSNAYLMILYGGIMAFLISVIVKKEK
ncbi:MAG: hypothetical protein ACOYIA_02595 [Eubacteriales bacterium]|jgi:hypothetical protein